MAAVIGLMPTLPVQAADPAAEAALKRANAEVSTLEGQKQELTGQMDDVEAQIVTTLAAIDSQNEAIETLEGQISDTQIKLDAAIERMKTQYAAMKKRIQFVYETGGDAGWGGVVLGTDNIDTILSSAEYTQEMYSYDQDCQAEYKATAEEVQSLKEQLTNQKADEEEKKNMLLQAESHLNDLKAQLKAQYADADVRLQKAVETAATYRKVVDEQNRQIAIIAAQQQAAAKAEQERQARAAAAAAAAQRQNRPAVNYTAPAGGHYSGGGQTAGASGSVSVGTASGTGNDVLSYAQQFLGGTYVWGGTSLSQGVDCSGYVQQIYKNFGVSLPRTSYEQANAGKAVSYSDMQTGDVVVYDGHVGIYAGNGQIINAANSSQGICYTPVDYAPIQTIRRVTG